MRYVEVYCSHAECIHTRLSTHAAMARGPRGCCMPHDLGTDKEPRLRVMPEGCTPGLLTRASDVQIGKQLACDGWQHNTRQVLDILAVQLHQHVVAGGQVEKGFYMAFECSPYAEIWSEVWLTVCGFCVASGGQQRLG